MPIDETDPGPFQNGPTPHTSVNEFTGTINLKAGPNIVINSGSNVIAVSASITSINNESGSLTLTAGPNITIDNNNGNFSITGSAGVDPDDLVGSEWSRVLLAAGITNNKWLNVEQGAINSDATPIVVPYKSKLTSLTFSNSDATADCEIQIHKAPAGSGNTDSVVFTWGISDARVSHKSDFTASITFEAGDKIGVFLKDVSGNDEAKDPAVHLLFRGISGAITGSGTEDYSGNF